MKQSKKQSKRVNWEEIFYYFISSETISMRDCVKKFRVNYGSLRQKATDEKWMVEKKKAQEARRHMVEIQINKSIAEINKKHVAIGNRLQEEAMKAMVERDIVPTTARDVKSWISTGQRIERVALGMNQPTQPIIETTGKITNESLLEEGEPKDKSA